MAKQLGSTHHRTGTLNASRTHARRLCISVGAARKDGPRSHSPPQLPQPTTSDGGSGASSTGKPPVDLKLPKLGYFALADTNAEVYSKAGEKFDPTQRGGRYKPEFIWNTDWQAALAREESLQKKADEAKSQPKAAASGFLSLSRMADLDSMDVDLSDVLRRKKQEDAAAAAAKAAAQAAAPPRQQRPVSPGLQGAPVFTRKEVVRLGRTSRSSARTAVVVPILELDEEKARVAKEERIKYEQLKVEQTLLTLGFMAAGTAMTYATYSREVSASYLVGALGGFMYLRLLNKSVDAVGGQGIESGIGGMASQPRLLIPLVLALSFNRWNQLYAEQVGVTLQLLPILAGFFTYKLALITTQAKEVYDGLGGGESKGSK